MRLRITDLLRTGIGRDHPLETLRQCDAGLAAAAADVPYALTRRRGLPDPVEQRIGIMRARLGIERSVAGEMVLEGHRGVLFPVLRKGVRKVEVSAGVPLMARDSAGANPFSAYSPICMRISRNVGRPTAAVIRRTCRLRPSRRVSSIQESGTDLRKRTGGSRGQSQAGAPSSARTCAGRVRPSFSSTPSRR